MVVPDMFGPVHARAQGVVFTPSAARHLWELKKWLWWLWRVSHCSRALVPGTSVDLCLCCLNKHLFNSARSEAKVWPNHAVHDFEHS